MKPRLLRAGFFWRSDDPADIIVGESSVNDVVCIAPTNISAVDLNKITTDEVLIRLDDLEFIVAGLFGADRPSPSGAAKWSGTAYRYGVYLLPNTFTKSSSIVILSHTPKGTRALILPRYATEAWKSVFYGMPSDLVWDICLTLRHVAKAQEAVTAEDANNFFAKKGEKRCDQ
jgi:hypothetical protein